MANTNNFKAFALDPNANVISQADWEALPALLSGFTAGKASSAQVNKAIRQATTISALIGQFIANSGVDALDNADVNGLVTKFTNALNTNLSLGGSAKLPSPLFSLGSTTGYVALPLNQSSSFFVQWFTVNKAGDGTTTKVFTFPVAFPNVCSSIVATDTGGATFSYGFDALTKTGGNLRVNPSNASTAVGARIIAIGY